MATRGFFRARRQHLRESGLVLAHRLLDQGYKKYKLAGPDELATVTLQPLDDVAAGRSVLVFKSAVAWAWLAPAPEHLL